MRENTAENYHHSSQPVVFFNPQNFPDLNPRVSTSVTPSTVTFSMRNSGCLFKMIFPLDVLQIEFSTQVLNTKMLSDPDPTVISLDQPSSSHLLFPVCFLCVSKPIKTSPWVGTNQSSRSPPLTKRIEALGTRMGRSGGMVPWKTRKKSWKQKLLTVLENVISKHSEGELKVFFRLLI